jgi:tetratricopeptide (TPR) repeat protein
MGMLEAAEQKYEDAEFHLKLARDQYRQADQQAIMRKKNLWMLAVIYQWLGQVHYLKQEFEQAESILLQGLDIAQEARSQQNIADIQFRLAELHLAQGKNDQALQEAEQAMAVYGRLGMEGSYKAAQELYQRIKK